MARLSPLRKRLLALGLSTILTLLGLELTLRLAEQLTGADFFHVVRSHENTEADTELDFVDLIALADEPALIYELAPGIRGTFQGAPVRVNGAGFVGPELPQERVPGSLRLALLGDSHIFGWGLPYEESLGPALEARLEAALGVEVEVLNLGVPGYNTLQEVAALESKGLAWEPDVALLLGCRNDAGLANFIRVPPNPWTLQRSYLYDAIEVRLKSLLRGAQYRNRSAERGLAKTRRELGRELIDEVSAEDLARIPEELRGMCGVEGVERALARLGEVARTQELPVIVSFYEQPEASALKGVMAEASGAAGLRFVDLGPAYEAAAQAHGAEALRRSAHDPHATAIYHAVIADALAPAVAQAWRARRGK